MPCNRPLYLGTFLGPCLHVIVQGTYNRHASCFQQTVRMALDPNSVGTEPMVIDGDDDDDGYDDG